MNGAPAKALGLARKEPISTRVAAGRVTHRQPAPTGCLFFAFVLTPQTPALLPAFA